MKTYEIKRYDSQSDSCRFNRTAYEYSKAQKYGWQEHAKDLDAQGFLLGYLIREACELAGVEYEHHTAETGDSEFEVYSIIYPAKTETMKGGDA